MVARCAIRKRISTDHAGTGSKAENLLMPIREVLALPEGTHTAMKLDQQKGVWVRYD